MGTLDALRKLATIGGKKPSHRPTMRSGVDIRDKKAIATADTVIPPPHPEFDPKGPRVILQDVLTYADLDAALVVIKNNVMKGIEIGGVIITGAPEALGVQMAARAEAEERAADTLRSG